MKKSRLKFVAILVAMTLLLTLTTASAFAKPNNKPTISSQAAHKLADLYGTYNLRSDELVTVMVELDASSIVAAKHLGKKQTKGALAQERKTVTSTVTAAISNSRVTREYDYLFSGFALQLPIKQMPELLALPGIRAVYPNVEYTVTGEHVTTFDWETRPAMMESAPFIGAYEAWDAGYTGEGITVAIIDTGADYTHPDLAHAFGDYKGWDFVDNDNDPQETPVGDPRGEKTQHGTHVSGTVAANGLIKGVAPDVSLLAYRVLGPGGSGSTENVIAGIERAVQDGADIMNLSLGNSLNSPDWATSIALDWAMAEGVVAVTSNGNNGPENWTVGSPGASRKAISVGATQLPYNVYTAGIFTSEEVIYTSPEVMGFPNDTAITDLNGETLEFVYVGLGNAGDFVGKDLTGKVALISRGAISFVNKSDNAKAAGAVATIIFNHLTGQIEHFVAGISLPTIKLSNADGLKMLAELAAGKNKVTFDIDFARRVDETVADFSSRGPVMDTWMIKPDVCAPGVNITSTVPTHNPDNPHGYAALQGTSMASPHVAGAAALLLEAQPGWGVNEVKAALMNTAKTLVDPNDAVYPHNVQGGGSIRILPALETPVLVMPGSHSFGAFLKNSGRQVSQQSFTVLNLTKEKMNVSFDVSFNGNPEGIKLMTSSNVRINGNKQQKISFSVQVDASKLNPGYYEGSIVVDTGSQVVDVPTILFIQEPDYPRISHFGIDELDEGYELWAYLPGGADWFEVWVYRDTPWGFVGNALEVEGPLPAGFVDFPWDGTINGHNLVPGLYHVFGWAEKAGVGSYLYGGSIEVPQRD